MAASGQQLPLHRFEVTQVNAKLTGIIAPTLPPIQQGIYLHALEASAGLCGDGADLTWNDEYLRGQAELIGHLVGVAAVEDYREHIIADIAATIRTNFLATARTKLRDAPFPKCTTCGVEVEDAGDHADNAGHWPR